MSEKIKPVTAWADITWENPILSIFGDDSYAVFATPNPRTQKENLSLIPVLITQAPELTEGEREILKLLESIHGDRVFSPNTQSLIRKLLAALDMEVKS